MSDIKQKLLQIGNAQIHEDVFKDFEQMSIALKNDRGIDLTVEESYLSIYELAEELRLLITNPNQVQSFVDISGLQLDKSMDEIVKRGEFQKLLDTLNNLTRRNWQEAYS